MEILNFDGATPSRKKRSNRALLAVGAILVAVVGSTYAANISINNAPVEYGQGVAQTTACDSSITVSPLNTFVNATGAGSFNLNEIDVYDTTTAANPTGLSNCAGKYLKVSVWSDTQTSSAWIACDIKLGSSSSSYTTGAGFASISIANSSCTGNGTAAVANANNLGGSYSNYDGFKITFTSPVVAAQYINKVTVESHV